MKSTFVISSIIAVFSMNLALAVGTREEIDYHTRKGKYHFENGKLNFSHSQKALADGNPAVAQELLKIANQHLYA